MDTSGMSTFALITGVAMFTVFGSVAWFRASKAEPVLFQICLTLLQSF